MMDHDELAGVAERYAAIAREALGRELPSPTADSTAEERLHFSAVFSLASIAASLAAERVRDLS